MAEGSAPSGEMRGLLGIKQHDVDILELAMSIQNV